MFYKNDEAFNFETIEDNKMTNEEIKRLWLDSGKTLDMEIYDPKNKEWIDFTLSCPHFTDTEGHYRFKSRQDFSVINNKVKKAWEDSGRALHIEVTDPHGGWIDDDILSFFPSMIYRVKPGQEITINELNDEPTIEDTGSHYRFEYKGIKLDPFRISQIYGMTSFAMMTILKKCLCAGNRGHNSYRDDLLDIINAAQRELEIIDEDSK